METPIKMDDLGVPLFLETPICFPDEVFFLDIFFDTPKCHVHFLLVLNIKYVSQIAYVQLKQDVFPLEYFAQTI